MDPFSLLDSARSASNLVSSGSSGSATSTALTKARLGLKDGSSSASVVFQYNPQSISFTKKAKWKTTPVPSSPNGTEKQFAGNDPIQLTMKTILDASEMSDNSVSSSVNLLAGWTNPTTDSINGGEPAAPELEFTWGEFNLGEKNETRFIAHLTSLSVEYTMFNGDGLPLRAKLGLTLESATEISWRQNPTSGGVVPRRQHVVAQGDRLPVIAAQSFGSTKHWRQLAEFNQISDPFNLEIGRVLIIPDASELV